MANKILAKRVKQYTEKEKVYISINKNSPIKKKHDLLTPIQ